MILCGLLPVLSLFSCRWFCIWLHVVNIQVHRGEKSIKNLLHWSRCFYYRIVIECRRYFCDRMSWQLDHCLPFTAEVYNVWSSTSTFPYSFMALASVQLLCWRHDAIIGTLKPTTLKNGIPFTVNVFALFRMSLNFIPSYVVFFGWYFCVCTLVFLACAKFGHISFITQLQELMLHRSLICWKLSQHCRGPN